MSGSAPLARRCDVLAEVQREPGARLTPASVWPGRREAWRDESVRTLHRMVMAEGPLTDGDSAELLAGCSDIRVRDTLLHRLTLSDQQHHWLRLWRCSVLALRRAPESHAAAVGAVAALAAWQLGDGLRAVAAIERALTADADHSLSRLLHRALDTGMPPSVWKEVMAKLSEDQCRHGSASKPVI